MARAADIPLRERKKIRTRAEIGAAAVTLIAERGLAAVRVDDICAVVGVGRSTFFRYFDSKESAFVEGVHRDRIESLTAALHAQPTDMSAVDALMAAVLVVAERWRDFSNAMRLEAALRNDSAQVSAWAARTGELWVARIAEALVPRFDGEVVRAHVVAGAVLAAVQVGYGTWIARGADDDPAPDLIACLQMLRDL